MHTHRLPSLSWCRSLCQKWELFYVERSSFKWKVNGQCWCNILPFQQMLAIIKHFVDDNIIYLSATQLMHAPVHGARNTVQQQNSQLRFFWAMAPTGQSWTQLITILRESTEAWIRVASTTNLKKSSSDCLNSGKAVIQHLCEKMRCSFFRVLPGIAEALRRWSWKINYHLTASYLSNVRAKNSQNRLM